MTGSQKICMGIVGIVTEGSGVHGPRNDVTVGVAKGQLLHKIYKYANIKYTL